MARLRGLASISRDAARRQFDMALQYGQRGQIPGVQIERFEWDDSKAVDNLARHGLSFPEATAVFLDPRRIVAVGEAHSDVEPRYFCIGALVDGSVATDSPDRRRPLAERTKTL